MSRESLLERCRICHSHKAPQLVTCNFREGNLWKVACGGRGCKNETDYRETQEEVIELWNLWNVIQHKYSKRKDG